MVLDMDSASPDGGRVDPPPAIIEWHALYSPTAGASASSPWPMVAIKENHEKNNPPIVFPPVDHENLHISPDQSSIPKQISRIQVRNLVNRYSDSESDTDSVTNSDSSATFSPSDSSPSACSPLFPSPKARPAVATTSGLFESSVEILLSKVNSICRSLWGSLSSSRGVFLTFRSAAAAAVLIAFLYFRQRRRLRAGQENIDRLIGVVNEREEKINQLLDQISRMNQVLLGLHRAPTT